LTLILPLRDLLGLEIFLHVPKLAPSIGLPSNQVAVLIAALDICVLSHLPNHIHPARHDQS
jgi:hypothetical protein